MPVSTLVRKFFFLFLLFFFKNKYLKREMLSDPRSGWKDVVGNGYDQNTLYTCMKSLNNKKLIFKKDNPLQACSEAHIPDDSETGGLIADTTYRL